MSFGARLEETRKHAKLSGETLGQRVGVSKQTISHWENGRYVPDVDQIRTLCDELGVTADYLVRGVSHALSAEALRFAHKYQKLSPEQRTQWARLVEVASASPRDFIGDESNQNEQVGNKWDTEKLATPQRVKGAK